MINFDDCKNIQEIKSKVRITLTKEIKDFLISKYGEKNISQIGINELGIAVGEIKDKDNFPYEICADIMIVAKSWTEPREGSKRNTEPFDRVQLEKDYQFELKRKGGHNYE